MLPPGGVIGGDSRTAVLELKAIGNAVVISFTDDVLLLDGGAATPLAGFDHLTIHKNLMVHVRGGKRTRRLRARRLREGLPAEALGNSAHYLCSASTGAAGRPARTGRFQSKWSGCAIFSFLLDAAHIVGRTQLVVDIWACGEAFRDFGRLLKPVLPNSRPACCRADPWYGPIPATWAFRADAPPCAFFFTFWYGEPDPGGQPILAAPTTAAVMGTLS